MGLRGELEGMGFNDTALSYDVSLAWSDSSIKQNYATLIRDRTEMALYGLGGPNCTPNGTPNLHFEAIPSFGGLSALFDTVFPGYVLNTRRAPLMLSHPPTTGRTVVNSSIRTLLLSLIRSLPIRKSSLTG